MSRKAPNGVAVEHSEPSEPRDTILLLGRRGTRSVALLEPRITTPSLGPGRTPQVAPSQDNAPNPWSQWPCALSPVRTFLVVALIVVGELVG